MILYHIMILKKSRKIRCLQVCAIKKAKIDIHYSTYYIKTGQTLENGNPFHYILKSFAWPILSFPLAGSKTRTGTVGSETGARAQWFDEHAGNMALTFKNYLQRLFKWRYCTVISLLWRNAKVIKYEFVWLYFLSWPVISWLMLFFPNLISFSNLVFMRLSNY